MPRVHPDEAQANTASIFDVPRALMPDGPARESLMRRAMLGYDCYAYQSGGPRGTWCVWLNDERIPVTEYVASFHSERPVWP